MQVYRFLTAEVKAYVPSYDSVTIYHLRDLAAGNRRIIHSTQVKVLTVPQYEGLTTTDMLSFSKTYPAVEECLPTEEREILKLPRAYIANVIYTNVGDPFADWVKFQIQDRNDKIASKRDLLVSMDPEIAKIFAASPSISGKSHLQF